jgi:alanyl-tRNA synthetase
VSSARLYYNDSYLTAFRATVAEVDADKVRVRLGHSAFYPTSGGQPFDTGMIAGIAVTEVLEDEAGRVVHVLAAPLAVEPGAEVACVIDADRRRDHMQQHTGQHLLSAVLAEIASAPTVSFHMGAQTSTIDLGIPSILSEVIERAEQQCNELIAENRRVVVSYEDAGSVRDLRKASDREGTLRIVSIEGLDRSACGGTHVRSTGEIGCILLRGTEKVRGNVRLEFVCGLRAVRRARADYAALSTISRTLSVGIDETPKLVSALSGRVSDAEKQRSRLAIELAAFRGREAFHQTVPNATGLRIRVVEVLGMSDEVRAEAQAFTAEGKAVAIAWCTSPDSVLMASSDSGVHAGNTLKPLLTERGGRGGGSGTMAQGGVPDGIADLVARIVDSLPGQQ